VNAEAPAASWTAVAAEALAGPRGIVKAVHVWWPLSLCLTASGGAVGWAVPLAAFGATACWSQAAILCNDVADRRQDAAAGKRRWAGALPAWAAFGAVVAPALLGLALIGAAGGGLRTGIVYAAAVALAFAYSLPPVRMKTRGPWGLVAYSGAACLAYVVMPWAWLGAPGYVLAAACPAVFLDKWVNLHFHQVVDAEGDRATGARTFAVALGPDRARDALAWAARLASAAMVGGVAFSAVVAGPWGWGVGGAGLFALAAIGVHVARARRRPEHTALVRELPWHYLGLTTALFRVVPAVLLLRLALQEAALRGAAALFAILMLIEARHLVGYRYR
jgi:chlorophyll synthase